MVKIPYAWYTVVGFAMAYKEVPAVLSFNLLNVELSPICHLLALLGAHHIFHVSGIRVNVGIESINRLKRPANFQSIPMTKFTLQMYVTQDGLSHRPPNLRYPFNP